MNRPDAKTVLMFALDFAALQRSIGKFLRQRRG